MPKKGEYNSTGFNYAVDDDGHGRGLVDIDVPIAQLLHLTPSNSPLIVPQTPALRKERARRTTRKTRRAPAALQRQNEQNTAKGPCFAGFYGITFCARGRIPCRAQSPGG